MKFFLLFLLFVTIWVIVICGFLYLARRSAPVWAAGRRRPGGELPARCCLEVPCSDDCAREHQHLRDLLTVRYGEVVHEIGKIVQAGRELEPARGLSALPDE